MAQLVDAWDMLELYDERTRGLQMLGASKTMLAASAIVLEECNRTPVLLRLHKTIARRAIALMEKRLNISTNKAFMQPVLVAKSIFENWNSSLPQTEEYSTMPAAENSSLATADLTPYNADAANVDIETIIAGFNSAYSRMIVEHLAARLDRSVKWSTLPDNAFRDGDRRTPQAEQEALRRIQKQLNNEQKFELSISAVDQTARLSKVSTRVT